MLTPPFPDHEPQRLKALYSLKLLDTKPEERFDRITRLTKHMFDVPIALVSLVDEHRQWFKSRQGLDACETGRDISFCGHAILGHEIFEVVDASKDSRFEDNPLVTGPPDIRFYAGVPLVNQSGYAIGTLCIIDSVARRLTHDERLALRDLADLILLEVDQAEQRQQAQDLKTAQKISQVIEDAQSNFIAEKDPRSAFDKLLTDILALTKSEYGFIGEVRHDADGSPYLKTHAITNIAWDEATSAFYEANAPLGMEFSNLNSLFGAALTNQKPVIANDPYHDPRRGGLPEGHPALNAFLGIPIRVGEELVAMIGIANRPGGYDQELVDFLSPLLVTIGQLIMAMRWQRQQAQDRQELTRLSKVVRETTNSVIITDLAGRVEWVNPGFARLTGYSFEEIKGKKPGEILQGPGSDQTTIDKIRVALSRQEGFDVELLNYAKEGRIYWVRIQCSPVHDETGNVSGFMAIESDITEMKRSQKALQQFKNTLDQTQDCVFMFDAETLRFLYVNDGAVKQVGYSQEELLKMHAYDIKPQYSEAAFRDLIAPFLVGDQTSLTFETDHQHKRGDHVPVEIALQYMTPEDSSPYFMAIVRDISEHKAMMQALQEERDMFSSGPVFAITWAPEAHWPVQYVSENIAEILGYSASEMCSPEFRYTDLIHPDDIGFVVSEVDYYIKNQVDTFEQSYRLRMKNGSYHWFYDFTKLLRDQQGRLKTIRGYMFDQSELKRVEQDLEESARQTEAILDNIVDGIIVIDAHGIVQSMNPSAQQIFGYDDQEVKGQNVSMLMPSPHREAHDGYLDHYLEGGEAKIIGIGREVEAMRKDGSIFPMDLAISEVSQQGKTLFVGIVRDISERKRIEKMKNEFVSTVSHELRTPLTSISGALGLIVGGKLGEMPAQAKQMLAIAHKNSQRLSHLINDLLDMEKIAAGKMEFDMQVQRLLPIIQHALESLQTYSTEQQVNIVLDERDVAQAEVQVDSHRLQQVLANLMSNAIKFSPKDGMVRIQVRPAFDKVLVSVTDEGPGIPDAFRDRIFEKFSQADASDTRKQSGTGLGLAITRELVERMQGQIGFESKEGEGTSFWFTLPLTGERKSDIAELQGGNCETRSSRILVVEDEPDVAEVLATLLAKHGYQVDIASTGEQALSCLQSTAYDAMTLDLMLPDIFGLEIINRVRQQSHTADIPIIVVSAKVEAGKLAMKKQLPSIDWLGKPIDENQLLKSLEIFIAAPDQKQRVLHIEDDKDLHMVISSMASEYYDFELATSLSEARKYMAVEPFDVVLLDIGLPDGAGWDLLSEIDNQQPKARVIILSGENVLKEDAAKVEAVLLKSRVSSDEFLETLNHKIKKQLERNANE